MYVGNLNGQSVFLKNNSTSQASRALHTNSNSAAGSTLTIKQVQRNPRTVSDFFSSVILKGTCKLPGTISTANLAIQQNYSKEDALCRRDADTLQIEDDTFFRETQVEQKEPTLNPDGIEKISSENGMSIRADFTWANLDLSAAVFGKNELGESIDYMASRYAAMKNCIESEDTGDEKASNLKQLDQLMEHYTDSLAQRFAEEVGGTFEKNGAAGVSDRLYQSILSEVTQRTAQYSAFITSNPDYADVSGAEEAWLRKDSAYMASELRKAVNSVDITPAQDTQESEVFTLKDMEAMQTFAQELESYSCSGVASANGISIGEESEESLGLKLAQLNLKGAVFNQYAGVSDNVKEIVSQSVNYFTENVLEQQEAYMDKWSQAQVTGYEKLRANGEISGSLAAQYIQKIQKGFSAVDRSAVQAVIDRVSNVYEQTGNANTAILEGAVFANNTFAEKSESGAYDGIHRYDSGDLYFRNLFQLQDDVYGSYAGQQTGFDSLTESWNGFMQKFSSEQGIFLTGFQFSADA